MRCGWKSRRRRSGDIADHGIDHGQQAFFAQLLGRVVQGHRSDAGHAAHILHRPMLAQQDFQYVAALGLLHQRRRQQADTAREAMGDAEIFHDCTAGTGTAAGFAASAAIDLR
jgi:hypothetical protein